MMTDLWPFRPAFDSARSNCGSVRPPTASEPTRRKDRRVRPSHRRAPGPRTVSMRRDSVAERSRREGGGEVEGEYTRSAGRRATRDPGNGRRGSRQRPFFAGGESLIGKSVPPALTSHSRPEVANFVYFA